MPSFLTPLVGAEQGRYQLRNRRSGAVVASRILPAFDSASRRTGLLKHTGLPADTAMVIAPCSSIHTVFMQFSIDVAFVARDGRIVKLRSDVRPWRLAAAFGAYAVVEMTSGAFARTDTVERDQLVVEPIDPHAVQG
jgi:uncharacterized membrane protein (UPF0127 family)